MDGIIEFMVLLDRQLRVQFFRACLSCQNCFLKVVMKSMKMRAQHVQPIDKNATLSVGFLFHFWNSISLFWVTKTDTFMVCYCFCITWRYFSPVLSFNNPFQQRDIHCGPRGRASSGGSGGKVGRTLIKSGPQFTIKHTFWFETSYSITLPKLYEQLQSESMIGCKNSGLKRLKINSPPCDTVPYFF